MVHYLRDGFPKDAGERDASGGEVVGDRLPPGLRADGDANRQGGAKAEADHAQVHPHRYSELDPL